MRALRYPEPILDRSARSWQHCLGDENALLGAYCNKPGGIEVARSDVIPLKAARGISPSALARRYLDGPPENPAAASPAFIYVLFYNDALCDQVPAAASGPQAKGAKPRPRARNRNPHVDIGPYPAMIYLNTRPPIGFKWEQKWNLLHEAGHVLGLAFRPVGASAGHCLNRACLMSGAGRYRYLGLQRRLCEQCVAQLAEASGQSPSTNQRFVGPVLVRSEAGYHVLSLPHREKVIVGELAENDCREFAAAVHAESSAPGGDENDWRSECWLKEEASHEPAALRDILKRAKAEPDELVRRVLSRFCAQACAGWYCAHGQYGDAVSTFREAILLSPEDDWDYNGLAWIKATCPDSSVRDGKEAVGAATKACELAEWKEWNWIHPRGCLCRGRRFQTRHRIRRTSLTHRQTQRTGTEGNARPNPLVQTVPALPGKALAEGGAAVAPRRRKRRPGAPRPRRKGRHPNG